MNTITINGVAYKLPAEQNMLSSVLNHLDMVKKGVKKFIKLYDLDGIEYKFSTTYLNSAKIDVKNSISYGYNNKKRRRNFLGALLWTLYRYFFNLWRGKKAT